MTKPLVVSIPHSLGREEAVRRLKTGLARAASSVPALLAKTKAWDGYDDAAASIKAAMKKLASM